MPRLFTDAKELLGDLLDRFETGTASPIGYPDYGAFASVVDADAFLKEIARTEEIGAVSVGRGRGAKRDQIVHVRMAAPEVLYRYLDRTPASQIAEGAGARLVADLALDPRLLEAAAGISAAWGRAKTWNAFPPAEAERLRDAFVLAQAILDGKHLNVDYRTFSRRTVGDSKTLERLEGAVVRLLNGVVDLPPAAKPREALRAIGLERFRAPTPRRRVHRSQGRGPVCGLSAVSRTFAQGSGPHPVPRTAGLHAHDRKLRELQQAYHRGGPGPPRDHDLRRRLSIAGGRRRRCGCLLARRRRTCRSSTGSDIDPDGTWIFHTIERAIGRSIRPHLMSAEIAEKFGKVPSIKTAPARCPPESGISGLAAYLSAEGAKTLEQEELDPSLPELSRA
jgi:hypothetical protein